MEVYTPKIHLNPSRRRVTPHCPLLLCLVRDRLVQQGTTAPLSKSRRCLVAAAVDPAGVAVRKLLAGVLIPGSRPWPPPCPPPASRCWSAVRPPASRIPYSRATSRSAVAAGRLRLHLIRCATARLADPLVRWSCRASDDKGKEKLLNYL
ncbi:hypothetical protein Syun_007346 [Stephania yunnanensis]|uniref:Uncharacterized protein n=1 Tax=Stephania yunnanensis TaxID=152371 RepID=A0AAP0PZA5_9MAGN